MIISTTNNGNDKSKSNQSVGNDILHNRNRKDSEISALSSHHDESSSYHLPQQEINNNNNNNENLDDNDNNNVVVGSSQGAKNGKRKGSDTSVSLSTLKSDLLNSQNVNHSTTTNTTTNTTNTTSNHNNNDSGVDVSERKGSDLSALSTNLMMDVGSLTSITKRKESDLSGCSSILPNASLETKSKTDRGIEYHLARRKESDASAASTLMSIRKESDASALSTLLKEHEEEMMEQEETMHASNVDVSSSNTESKRRKDSFSGIGSGFANADPFEKLRKLSDTSTVVSLEQLQRIPTKFDDIKDTANAAMGITASNLIGLGDMKLKLETSKDDSSVATFENPAASTRGQTLGDKSKPQPANLDMKFSTIETTDKNNDKLSSSALDHLDALGPGKHDSDDGSHSTVTISEANHKMLVDALLMTGHPNRRNRAESWGGMSDISQTAAAVAASSATAFDMQMSRGPSPQGMEYTISPRSQGSFHSLTDIMPKKIDLQQRGSRERLDSFSSERERFIHRKRERLDSFKVEQRDRNESIDFKSLARDRLDSFRGDRERLESFDIKALGRERMEGRDRLDSIANLSGIFSRGRDRLDSLASLGEVSLSMSVGDLEEVAEQLEHIANRTGEDSSVPDSELSYVPKNKTNQRQNLSAPTIQVDSEAVQAAVKAAMAATEGGVLDFLNIKTPQSKRPKIIPLSAVSTPLATNIKQNQDQMEAIRERARAAAGYVHPDKGGPQSSAKPRPKLPTKKRSPLNHPYQQIAKRYKLPMTSYDSKGLTTPATKAPSGALIYSNFNSVTPKRQNYGSATKSVTSTPGSTMSKGGQSNQKWDEMYECLVLYVKEEKEKASKGLSDEEIVKWEWSGNVPTMFKTKDGKALGRWINNQRSAKSKGTLKREREIKLVSTGLKWSVLTTNAWTDMMKELKIYVDEKVSISYELNR